MDDAPLISIVMPVHNAAAWLEETLRTVLASTFDPRKLELILVDDASTDDSAAIARRVLAESPIEWRIVASEARNPSGARNNGWRHARAKWIQFFDSDDLMAAEKLAWQYPAAEKSGPETALLFSDFQLYEQVDGQWQATELRQYAGDPPDAITDLITSTFFVHLSSGLIRRAWLERLQGFDEQFPPIEDVNLSLRMVREGGVLRYVPTPAPVFLYRMHGTSLTKRMPDRFVDRCAANARLVEEHVRRQNGLTEQRRERVASVYLMATRYFAGRQDWEKFEQFVGWLEGLQTPYVPPRPPQLKLLSQAVGYRRAERWIVQARKVRDWVRR